MCLGKAVRCIVHLIRRPLTRLLFVHWPQLCVSCPIICPGTLPWVPLVPLTLPRAGLSTGSARVDYSTLLNDMARRVNLDDPDKNSGEGESDCEWEEEDKKGEKDDDENVVSGDAPLNGAAASLGSAASRLGRRLALLPQRTCLPPPNP